MIYPTKPLLAKLKPGVTVLLTLIWAAGGAYDFWNFEQV
jgi:hypothetical protein